MNYTCAPWEFYESDFNGFRFADIKGNNKLLFQNMLIDKHNKQSEGIANSYLVSAAPELLEALEALLLDIEVHIPNATTVISSPEYIRRQSALNVISKARGLSCK